MVNDMVVKEAVETQRRALADKRKQSEQEEKNQQAVSDTAEKDAAEDVAEELTEKDEAEELVVEDAKAVSAHGGNML